MKNNLFVVISIIISFSNQIWSQSFDFENYSVLGCQGEIPEDILNPFGNDNDKFLSNVNILYYQMIQKGQVLFGDPVTKYVNKVANEVLLAYPNLDEKPRFYCIKSNSTYAFVNDQGVIFIPLGLIAQLENEAQLAFIIHQKIQHLILKHEIKKDDSTQINSIDSQIGELSDYNFTNYSISNHLEADSAALFSYARNGYDTEEIKKMFTVLQFAYLPFSEIPFDVNELVTIEKIPNKFILDIETPINIDSDTLNIKERRKNITKLITQNNFKDNDKKFLVSNKVFEQVKTICQFESIRLDLINLKLIRAYYHAKLLLKKFPENYYLKLSTAKALYGIVKVKNKYKGLRTYKENEEGAISKFYYFFENVNFETLANLTIKYLFELNKEYDDSQIQDATNNLIQNFIKNRKNQNFNFDKYFFQLNETKKNETIVDSTTTINSKYDKLMKIKQQQKIKSSNDKLNHESELKNDVFHLSIYQDYIYLDEIRALFIKNKTPMKKKKLSRQEIQKQNQKNYKLIQDKNNVKAVVVSPLYQVIDYYKGINYGETKNQTIKYINNLNNISTPAHIDLEFLSVAELSNLDVDKYNIISNIFTWQNEISIYNKISINENFIPSQNLKFSKINKTLGTNYLIFTTIQNFEQKKKGSTILVTREGSTFYFNKIENHYKYIFNMDVYDTQAKLKYINKSLRYEKKPIRGLIQSYIYQSLINISLYDFNASN